MTSAGAGYESSPLIPNPGELIQAKSAEFDGMRDHCGVWAIWDPANPHLLDDAFIGLQNIQHRGDGGAGVAVVSPTVPGMSFIRSEGTVREVFGDNGERLGGLPADAYAANGQTRYPTDESTGEATQPRIGRTLSLSHNGQFTNKEALAERYGIADYTSDTDVVAQIIDKEAVRFGGDVERAVRTVLPRLEGAFCLTILTPDKLIAVRDRHGVRPLQLGRTETGGYVVASEKMAVDHVPGAAWEREIGPTEMVVIDTNGVRSGQWADADPATCVFEYIYLSNKSNVINGLEVAEARRELGRRLARHFFRSVSVVVPIPNSGNQAAHGYESVRGVPLVHAFRKRNEDDAARSFMQPDDESRIAVAESKLVLQEPVESHDVLLVDDSLVRGISAAVYVRQMREAGAKTVHLALAAPEITEICSLGVDTADHDELMAVRHDSNLSSMARELGVDSLTFLPRSELLEVLGTKVCSFCVGGDKPNPFPASEDIDEEFESMAARTALPLVSA